MLRQENRRTASKSIATRRIRVKTLQRIKQTFVDFCDGVFVFLENN